MLPVLGGGFVLQNTARIASPSALIVLNSKRDGFVLSITAHDMLLVIGGCFVSQNTAPNVSTCSAHCTKFQRGWFRIVNYRTRHVTRIGGWFCTAKHSTKCISLHRVLHCIMHLPASRIILDSKRGGFVLSITAQDMLLVLGGGFVLQNTAPNASPCIAYCTEFQKGWFRIVNYSTRHVTRTRGWFCIAKHSTKCISLHRVLY